MGIDKSEYMDSLMGRGRFVSVANELLETEISTSSKLIFIYVLSKPSNWSSSRNNVAANLRISKNTVSDCLRELEKCNMIAISSREDSSWNLKINPPDVWLKGLDQNRSGSKLIQGLDQNRSTLKEEIKKREERKDFLSIEDIYKVWLSSLPERVDFTNCQEELRVLFETLKSNGHTADDLKSSFKVKVLKRWEKSKYPERQEQIWDRLVGEILLDAVKLSDPVSRPSKSKNSKKGKEGEIDIDYAIRITTDDDDIQRMMQEYARIQRGDFEDGK
jgi:hypothetical protein